MDKKLTIGASCTWGEGPDVLLVLDGKPLVCYEDPKNDPPPRGQWKHGYVSKGSIDLTRNEALELAEQLFRAAAACRELDDGLKEYFELEGQIAH